MTGAQFTDKMLLALARDSRKKAYAPYSRFTVGAACRGGSGTVYFGCNVENSSYPVGICAERSAVSNAISHGEKIITAIAVAGGRSESSADPLVRPCGMCLQFLSEFMSPDGIVLIADGDDKFIEYSLADLIPVAFKLVDNQGDG